MARTPPPRRLVRRQPLSERIKAYLNPFDFLLWVSEELDSNDWDELQREHGLVLGLGINLVFLVARANSVRADDGGAYDDVFGEGTGRGRSGWMSWLATLIVHFLTLVSVLNGLYTFLRKRHYRLFEASVDTVPSTPSAQRVRVDSSPVASASPLRLLTSAITRATASSQTAAEARSHPSSSRDVWEVAVWDPLPACLKLFCVFSPGHVLVYWLFLPIPATDARPSVTIFTTVLLGVLLSAQLLALQTNFSQQAKDTSIIHREVMNEYDTKFVHPRMNPPVRDVGTQYDSQSREQAETGHFDRKDTNTTFNVVETYTPTTIIKKGFHVNPNPNYAEHYDPDDQVARGAYSMSTPAENRTPPTPAPTPAMYNPRPVSSALRPAATPLAPPSTGGLSRPDSFSSSSSPLKRAGYRQPQFRTASTDTRDGGSLGVYTHANSPLKKTQSMNVLGERPGTGAGAGASRHRASVVSPAKRARAAPGTAAGAQQTRTPFVEGRRRESGYF